MVKVLFILRYASESWYASAHILFLLMLLLVLFNALGTLLEEQIVKSYMWHIIIMIQLLSMCSLKLHSATKTGCILLSQLVAAYFNAGTFHCINTLSRWKGRQILSQLMSSIIIMQYKIVDPYVLYAKTATATHNANSSMVPMTMPAIAPADRPSWYGGDSVTPGGSSWPGSTPTMDTSMSRSFNTSESMSWFSVIAARRIPWSR